jgi:hypothetical protein
MSMAQMAGARLAYVVVPQEGSVRRNVHKWTKGKGVVVTSIEEPAGFLVYFPRGHVIRIRDKKELRHYKLDKDPQIVNLQGLNDPNSPIGKLMMAQDESSRTLAMANIQKSVMQLAQAQSGRIELTRDPADLYYHEEAA